jgi:uncharacterized protein YggE
MTEQNNQSNRNNPVQSKSNKLNLHFSVEWRWIALGLLLVIVAMLAMWRPWSSQPDSSARTISVTGESTITASPDEFVFSPAYEFKNTDKKAALAALNDKQDEIVSALKKLGVADSKIKTDSNGFDYYFDDNDNTYHYTLSLTVTVNDKTLAQKVQDYLLGTAPSGEVSPSANFSETTRKKVESQARDGATKDARSKADQSAQNLGFSVGKVKSVNDSGFGSGGIGCGGGMMCPLAVSGQASDSGVQTKSLAVQPGQNDLSYSVTVVYYLK